MNKYSEELKKLLKQSELIAIDYKCPFVYTDHFLLALLKTNNKIKNILNKNDITFERIKNYITKDNNKEQYVFYSIEMLEVLDSIILSIDDELEEITPEKVFEEILKNKNTKCYKLLKCLDININSLLNEIKNNNIKNSKSLIREIAINLNEKAINNEIEKLIGRDNEIDRIINILARKNKNNPILIGEAGVGKSAIIEELAKRITTKNVPLFLRNKTILSLNLGTLIAGTKYRGEFEEKLTKIISELENDDDIILFIDEVHSLVGAGGAEGAIDASNILKPALARGKIKVIGATTTKEYNLSIANDKALDRRFQKVLINEPSNEETKNIIKKIKKDYENYHNVILKNDVINLLVDLASIYIKDRHEPDRSIDLLDEVCAIKKIESKNNNKSLVINKIKKLNELKKEYIKKEDYKSASKIKKEIDKLESKKITEKNTKTIVTTKALKKVLENKVMMPIYELENSLYLENLKKNLKSKLNISDNLIDKLITITHNTFSLNRKKLTSILFKGSNLKLCLQLANNYADNLKLNKIIINGNELCDSLSLSKVIGSPSGYVGYNEKNTLFESVKMSPVSLIIINDFDSINIQVQNTIKDIIKNNTLKLANNEIIDFSSTIFIIIKKANNENLGFINSEIQEDKICDNTLNINENSLCKL